MSVWGKLADLIEAKPSWEPTPKQQIALEAVETNFETLFGGSAGGGKTLAVANYSVDFAERHAGAHIGIVRKALPYLKQTHLLILRPLLHGRAKHNAADLTWTFPNGSIIRFISLPNRGDEQNFKSVEFDLLCFDEVTELPEEQYTYMLTRVRSAKGHRPHVLCTANPEGVGYLWVKKRFIDNATPFQSHTPLLANGKPGPSRVYIPATVYDNPHLLKSNPGYIAQLEAIPDARKRAALLDGDWDAMSQIEGALFDLQNLDDNRVTEPPTTLARVVVAVDPAVTFTDTSDEFGIVAAATGADKTVYVLADASGRFSSPDAAMRQIMATVDQYGADTIIFESNQGGEFIRKALRAGLENRPVRLVGVHAKRGKALRAEPVSVLYAQNRVRHCPGLSTLEQQMVTWTPDNPQSPDRLDALVYAVTNLTGRQNAGRTHQFT